MAQKNGLDSGNRSTNSSAINGQTPLAHHLRASVSGLGNSAEKSDSSDSGKTKVVPHYLRASTGSCHNHCKYGGEHSFEKKEWKPVQKRLPNKQPFVEILLSDKQKNEKPSTDAKTHSPDRKPSPKPDSSLDKSKDTKNHSPDMPSVKSCSPKKNGSSGNKTLLLKKPSKRIPAADPPEIVKGVIFPSAEVEDSVKRGTSIDEKLSKKTYTSQPRASPVKLKPVKAKPSAYPENSDGGGIRNGGAKTGKNLTASKSLVKKVLTAPVATLSPKLSVKKIARSNSAKAGALKFVSRDSSGKDGSLKLVSRSNSGKDGRLKLVSRSNSVKDGSLKLVSRSNSGKDGRLKLVSRSNSGKDGSLKLISRSNSGKDGSLKLISRSNSGKDRSLKLVSRSNSGKAGNGKLVSSIKDPTKLQRVKTEEAIDEKVLEKTLHVIETEIEHNVSESTPGGKSISTPPSLSSAESSSLADSSSLSSHEDDQIDSEADEIKSPLVKETHDRKSRTVVSEDKCRKLKFRSGKVVDFQMDNNSPRRLRFRRGSVVGVQGSKGETRRALKKAGAKGNTISAEVSPEKVVLKHQDVQDKKDAQGLLNNVIEETASKLVKSRKSKVKALVGAFETVISLQETK